MINLPIPLVHAYTTVLTPLEREIAASLGVSALKQMEAQERALEAYSILCDYCTQENGEIHFPDTFAGEYVIGDILYIYLTDTSERSMHAYTKILTGYEDVIKFEKRLFSYNYLCELQEKIVARGDREMTRCYADTIENKVMVGIDQSISTATKNTVQTAWARSGLPVETFEEDRAATGVSEIKGGDRLFFQNSSFTMAACGVFNGQPAILTCGHGGDGNALPGDSGGPIVQRTSSSVYLAGSYSGQTTIHDGTTIQATTVYFSPYFLIDDIFTIHTGS